MKRLQGFIKTKEGAEIPLDAEAIVITLSHGKQISIRPEEAKGSDGVALYCGIDRENQTANGRFVIRALNFAAIVMTVEPAK